VPGDVTANPQLFLADGAWQDALPPLAELVSTLERSRYSTIGIVPENGGWLQAPLDPGLFVRALTGRSNLFHECFLQVPFRALAGVRSRQALELREIFHLCRWTPRDRVERLLPPALVDRLHQARVLETSGDEVRSRVAATPVARMLVLSDPVWLQRHDEYVYMGRTSMLTGEFLRAALAGAQRPASGGRLLDLGCGCGVLGLAGAAGFDEVVGTDIVERCLSYAKLNAALNGIDNCRFEYSDLFSHVEGTFDVVVANPPCTWTPEGERAAIHADGGSEYGTDLPARAIAGAHERLRPGGIVYSTLECPVIRGEPQVVRVLERALGRLGATVTVYPLFTEYAYQRARLYREHGIQAVVRYVAVIRPATGFTLRFERSASLLRWGYAASAASRRLLATLTGGPRDSTPDVA
jgi:SAM-dependent methyltransferase